MELMFRDTRRSGAWGLEPVLMCAEIPNNVRLNCFVFNC